MNDLLTLILGTSAMLIMITAVVSFAFVFQRKLLQKQQAFAEIEKLVKKQELRSAYALIDGQEQERRRIAAELHDNIGNILATLKIYSDLAIRKTQSEELSLLSEKINTLTETLTEEVRKISHSLDEGTLRNFGLMPALEQLCEAIEVSGKIKIDSIIDLSQAMESELALQVYRIIQELFTNTLKHARASAIRFELTQVNNDISIIYEDNGVGFDVHAQKGNSMGLKNIASRLSRIQGDITIQSTAAGSTFIIEIPTISKHD